MAERLLEYVALLPRALRRSGWMAVLAGVEDASELARIGALIIDCDNGPNSSPARGFASRTTPL